MDTMQTILKTLAQGEDLSVEQSSDAMRQIMAGEATHAQIGAFLMGLRTKGETVDEITGAAMVMRENAITIPVKLSPGERLVDTCGTGGDGTNTFNVSTAVAFVVAGSGLKVAKHGNRSISSRSGSADCLEALGIDITLSPEQCARCIETVGLGFLFAPNLHPAMKYAAGPRRELGIRTIFNILGPLANPAGANTQLMGVFSRALCEPLAQVLGRLGVENAWVVHGDGGLDELSLSGPNLVARLKGGEVKTFKLSPEDAGLDSSGLDEVRGGEASENASIVEKILRGAKGPQRDIVLFNAGAVLSLAGKAEGIKEGVEMAAGVIDSGQALNVLENLRKISTELTGG